MNEPTGDTMQKIIVDAYDERHPAHEYLVNLECDTGLDITLYPSFEVEIEVPEIDATQ